MKRVRYEPEAIEELGAAVEWYESERPGLGHALVDEVEAVVATLESGTAVALPIPGLDERDIRRVLLPRFPYAIVFTVHEGVVRIIAVAHSRRRPRYWTTRDEP